MTMKIDQRGDAGFAGDLGIGVVSAEPGVTPDVRFRAGLRQVGREVAQSDAEHGVAKGHRQALPEQDLPAPGGAGRETHCRSFRLAGGGLLVGRGKSQISARRFEGIRSNAQDHHYQPSRPAALSRSAARATGSRRAAKSTRIRGRCAIRS